MQNNGTGREHWNENSWEDKARENPLYAVMSTPQFLDAQADTFSADELGIFFGKGVNLFETHIAPLLAKAEGRMPFVVEYGCGMGRILKAVKARGYRCAGIDISPTMLEHCRNLAPGVDELHLLDQEGSTGLPSECAGLVYSYAVVQHIDKLSNYLKAIREMCRLVEPGGFLAVQINCEDFQAGDLDNPGRTENYETYSVHYHPGSSTPYKTHRQGSWSGVYIGYQAFCDILAEFGIAVEGKYFHNLKKPRAIWVTGRRR